MNATQATVCCLLLAVLVLDAVPGSNANNLCGITTPFIPFCKDWMCEVACMGESMLFLTKLQESKCRKGGITGWCYCKFC